MIQARPLAGPSAPRIDPVPEGAARPSWSVMIPTYNCAGYLRQTLESVLAQDPGPDRMQIEVVDDASTKDDPGAVVREVGKGRVQFHRHPQNLGSTRNFNECLRRSRGRWVHLLHGDDYVLPGFYERVEAATGRHPGVGMVATRVFVVDEGGEIESLSSRCRALEAGGRNAADYCYGNPFLFAGVVLARDFAEEAGGFDLELVHTTDWEMWIRAITRRGGVSINAPLACYRVFAGNETSRLMQTGENLRDYLRAAERFRGLVAGFDLARFRGDVARMAAAQAGRFRAMGNREAARANQRLWRELATWPDRARATFRSLRSLVRPAGATGS